MRAQLVTDSDLHVAHLAIVLSKTTAEAMPAVTIPKLKAVVLPKVLALLQSSLLQGVALRSLLALFAELVSQNVAELSFDALTTQLLSVGKAGTMSKHTLAALSQLVAACCAHVPAPAKRDTMVTHFTGQLSDGAAQQRTLALLCLGEIGRQTDLSAHKNLVAAVMTGFTMPEEEVKAAASFALGNIAAGNLPLYLPHLLKAIDTSQVIKANARIPLTSTSAFCTAFTLPTPLPDALRSAPSRPGPARIPGAACAQRHDRIFRARAAERVCPAARCAFAAGCANASFRGKHSDSSRRPSGTWTRCSRVSSSSHSVTRRACVTSSPSVRASWLLPRRTLSCPRCSRGSTRRRRSHAAR